MDTVLRQLHLPKIKFQDPKFRKSFSAMITFGMLKSNRSAGEGHRFEMSTMLHFSLKWRKVPAAKNEDDYEDTLTHIVDMSPEKSDKKVFTFLDYLAVTSEEEMQVTAV